MEYKKLKEKLETIITLPELPFEIDLTGVDCKQMYDILCKIEQGGLKEIPKSAVVLSATETMEKLEDLLVLFDEMSFSPLSLCAKPEEYAKEWKRKLVYVIGEIRKEMAKEIYEEFFKMHTEVYNSYVFKKDSDYDDLETNAIINFSDSLSFVIEKYFKEKHGVEI